MNPIDQPKQEKWPMRDYQLEERMLQKYFVPQFPAGFLPTMGERLAFQAGRDSITREPVSFEEWQKLTRLMLDFHDLQPEHKEQLLLMIDGYRYRAKAQQPGSAGGADE